MFMDNLSRKLQECKTGCMVGGRLVNHLLYADDLVVLSPYSAGPQQLLRACSDYGMAKKSVVTIARTKEDQKLSFPFFNLNENQLTVTKA